MSPVSSKLLFKTVMLGKKTTVYYQNGKLIFEMKGGLRVVADISKAGNQTDHRELAKKVKDLLPSKPQGDLDKVLIQIFESD